MVNTIVTALKESGVYGWEVSDEKTSGWEFYFIRHQLDQNRVKNVEHITVRVYQLMDDGKALGSASAEIAPTATAEEGRALVKSLAYRATLVKNRPYTLTEPKAAEPARQESVDVPAIARSFVETMQSLPETAEADINSYEIFVEHKTHRLITSTGIDVEESYPESMVEVVVNARKDGHEIELYRNYHSGSCDAEGLRKDLVRTMHYGLDRLHTQPTPALGQVDLLLTTQDAKEVYGFFEDRLNTALVYQKLSNWELGKPVVDQFCGDAPTLTAVRELPNSSRNHAFDAEGAPIRDTVLLEQGVARAYVGRRMFSSYLGLEDSFQPMNFVVSGGSHSAEELHRSPYLEVVEFSDFQVDSMTGDIFGEIRLAYWHDGEKVTPVSGGSVSGSMMELAGQMEMSKEQAQYNNWLIPAVTRIHGVVVTGAQ